MALEDLALQMLAQLPEQTLDEIMAELKDGAETPAEVFGLDPDILDHIERMALGYYRANHYDKAAIIYAFLIRMQPKRGSAWRGLGALAQSQKNFAHAVVCFEQALAFDEKDFVSRVFLGESLCQLGMQKEGLMVLNEAVEMGTEIDNYRPYIARAHAVIGAEGGIPARVVLMEQGRSLAAEAKAELTAGGFEPTMGEMEFDPDAPLTTDAMLSNPKLKKTIEELKVAVNEGRLTYAEIGGFTENEMEGAYACAAKYAEMGQVVEAIQISGYLMFLNPYEARYYQLVGICLQRMKQYEAAEHYYRMALILDKENAMSKVYLGETLIMAGRMDEGVTEVKAGMALAQGDPAQKDLVDRGKVLVQQFSS